MPFLKSMLEDIFRFVSHTISSRYSPPPTALSQHGPPPPHQQHPAVPPPLPAQYAAPASGTGTASPNTIPPAVPPPHPQQQQTHTQTQQQAQQQPSNTPATYNYSTSYWATPCPITCRAGSPGSFFCFFLSSFIRDSFVYSPCTLITTSLRTWI